MRKISITFTMITIFFLLMNLTANFSDLNFPLKQAFAISWYPGDGLRQGDFYRYSVCWADWHNCTPFEIDFWVSGPARNGGWNMIMLAKDGSIVQKGIAVIGTVTPDPTYSDPNISDYANVYKNTLTWLDSFSTELSPRDLSSSWGKVASSGGNVISPMGQQVITVQGGRFQTWILGWHYHSTDNQIWIDSSLAFPVKAIVYAPVTSGSSLDYKIELLEHGNSATEPTFLNVQSSGGSSGVGTITVATDKTTYGLGDYIKVSGHASGVSLGTVVHIYGVYPNNLGNFPIRDTTTDSQGDYSVTSPQISNSPLLPSGQYMIDARTDSGLSDSTAITINTNVIIAVPGSASSSSPCVASKTCFSPNPYYTTTGTTITFVNADNVQHTFTSGHPTDAQTGTVFDSGFVAPLGKYQFTFQNQGTYDYFCQVHPWMTGTIIVQGSSGGNSGSNTQFSVTTDQSSYQTGTTVTISLHSDLMGQSVAIGVVGPNNSNEISRVLTTDSQGYASLMYKIRDDSPSGTYKVFATASFNGNNYQDSKEFTVTSSPQVTIVSVQPTDQNGNPVTSFTRGTTAYVKVTVTSSSSIHALVTTDIFDLSQTSLGVGDIGGMLVQDNEWIISFYIPQTAQVGQASIFADVYTDWPANGGTPLAKEYQANVDVQ